MGKNFLFGCAMACCLPLCSTVVQRQAVAKHAGISSNLVEDIALSCCCSCCVMTQCTQEIGEKADIRCVRLLVGSHAIPHTCSPL